MSKICARPDVVGRLVAARRLRELAVGVESSQAVVASGLWGSSVAAVVAALREHTGRNVLLVCGHLDEADDLADDVELFTGDRPAVLPALEITGGMGRISEEQVSNRLRLVHRLAAGSGQREAGGGQPATSNQQPATSAVLVSPIQALMQSVPSRDEIRHLVRTVSAGEKLEPEKLIVWLSEHGYNRLDQCEVPGDFAVRGGIIDVYLPGDFDLDSDESSEAQVGLPVRIDFFDDQVESIKRFDVSTLGSLDRVESVRMMDVKGQMDHGAGVNLMHYLDPRTVIVLWAPLEIAEQARSYLERLPDQRGIYPLSTVLKIASGFKLVELSPFDQGGSVLPDVGKALSMKLPVRSLQRFETEARKAISELVELTSECDVTVFCENAGEQKRFRELLDADAPGLAAKIDTPIGYLHRGFIYEQEEPARPLALLGHHELFHRYEQRRRVRKVIASRPVDSFLDLKVGDYVVHVAHGIAKFTGIQTMTKDGRSEEYLTLRFAENAALHVPASRINLIQKYIGGFQGHPQLSRLGSGAWEKQKAKVSEAVMDMAADLIELQAARAGQPGLAFPPDSEWQKEFEAEFPYEPTADQVTGAQEIKQDMQKPRPMDRLLCGDVGYGKTELAMRAAFKACEHGKQVAVLVPTTVLAEQHYRSFRERMVNYPFAIESISRFRTAKEQRDILSRVARGEVDILIGTHRLISRDVKFADLGLVIVDEEQRFGVTHKERLKQMRKEVDVLTMSATPIPRTLHMSLLGLRDISSLTTAPQDRRSVVTEVMAYDKQRIQMAIQRELAREGQVYFVHNRVHNIIEVADEIQRLVPDARILIGHGQMGEGELEEVMLKFIRHDADVLVCTTIIESGLDIPNANTILINQADRFGLSELHQLRGRVGRWKHRAYCYLLLPADRPVTPVAAKRLKAIEEYSHLGAGFKIAMRDLELRGAGNILGPEQSGHIATVGYEMYCQLLEEAVRDLKKEAKPVLPEAHVDIGVSAFLPRTYIPGDRQRMDVYRRLTRCTSLEMLGELKKDVADAFGEMPHQAVVLFALTELRLLAGHFGIDAIIRKDPDVVLTVREAAKAHAGFTGAPGTLRVIDEKTVYLRMPPTYMVPETLLIALRNLLRAAYDRQQRGEPPPSLNKPATSSAPATGSVPEPSVDRKALKPSLARELEQIAVLRDKGVLSDEEFRSAKSRLLNA